MPEIRKIGKLNLMKFKEAATILHACGKDMAKKYDLHHWDNPYLKTFAIVLFCSFNNDVYLLYDNHLPSATFMIKKQNEILHFEKLGTLPSKSGKGIGSFCMNKIEEMAKESGCQKVTMEVYEPSRHAVSFYEHKGYKVVGTADTLKYKELMMEKEI